MEYYTQTGCDKAREKAPESTGRWGAEVSGSGVGMAEDQVVAEAHEEW